MTTTLSRDERVARGKAARRSVTRAELGRWSESTDRRDPVAVLTDQARGRLPDLVPLRNSRMLASPFAFFRGGAAVMAADLAGRPTPDLRAQLCGDAHLSNFGGYAAPDRQIVFDLNDFDETLPGPFEWDVKRLVASFAIAGRERGFDPSARRALAMAAAEAYRTAMREFAAMGNLEVWYTRLSAASIVERWGDRVDSRTMRGFERRLQKAMTRDSVRATSKLTRLVDGTRRMVSDPPLLLSSTT